MMVYLIGSLRDPNVRTVAKVLRDRHIDVFDDWHAAGEKGDEEWMSFLLTSAVFYSEQSKHF
jgi:hypothetical protein